MRGEGSQQVDAELPLRVENREVEAEKLLVRRTIMLLTLLRHTEDVAQQYRLLWDCQACVLVEPPQVSMAENTPLALESLFAPGQDEERAGLCLCPRFEGLGHNK